MQILQINNVVRAYRRGVPVLDGTSFAVEKGEVVGLLGRNGAGKTTLLRILMGMIKPQSGAVRVFGMDPQLQPVEIKRRTGFVAEDQVYPPLCRASELLLFHRSLYAGWDNAMEDELVSRFGLRRDARISEMSKGEARQVALICAVCHKPELLILDEPAGGLDPAARREFLETSIQLLNRAGTTILFSSHHMADVERIASRVVLLDKGKVCIDSDLDQLRETLCIAVVPLGDTVTVAALEAVLGCVRARNNGHSVHGVFHGDPDEVAARIAGALRVDPPPCQNVPLEELFIEIVGR
ncbi:MAG: ABC transporter ATP-binding protein [Acidobacteria bacterium]|nr:ABC transporter ATP-binding protein [Acidobacteriota bacterium]